MIGNEHDAQIALRDFTEDARQYLFSDEGGSRSVHLVNGIIYKVDRAHFKAYATNKGEYENSQILREVLPEGVTVPDMSLYQIGDSYVIACEFIDGAPTGECMGGYLGIDCDCDDWCMDYDLCVTLTNLGWTDQSYGNAILTPDGTVYLVDVA